MNLEYEDLDHILAKQVLWLKSFWGYILNPWHDVLKTVRLKLCARYGEAIVPILQGNKVLEKTPENINQ